MDYATDIDIPAPRDWSGLPLRGNGLVGGESAQFDAEAVAARAEAHAREINELDAITRFINLFERGDPQAPIEKPLCGGETEPVCLRIYESLAHARLCGLWSAELFEIMSACMRSGDEKLRNKARALVAHMAMEYGSDCTVARG